MSGTVIARFTTLLRIALLLFAAANREGHLLPNPLLVRENEGVSLHRRAKQSNKEESL